jgi:hypothetical protein
MASSLCFQPSRFYSELPQVEYAAGVAKWHKRCPSHRNHSRCSFSIWKFSDGFLLAWETLAEPTEARWFNVLSALCEGVLGPVLALSAIALSLASERLLLATILAILAAVIYVAPIAAFFIEIMIYGF